VGLVLLLGWFFGKNAKKPNNWHNLEFVEIKGKKVKVEIARTPAQRARGLMFRTDLPKNSGMLFIFETEALHGFWMANTKIPLDIVWIDSTGKIVDISKNTPPCTQTGNLQAICKTYKPKIPALYVLELNGGWTNENELKIGDNVTFLN